MVVVCLLHSNRFQSLVASIRATSSGASRSSRAPRISSRCSRLFAPTIGAVIAGRWSSQASATVTQVALRGAAIYYKMKMFDKFVK
jgi:hypothetical protein